MYFNPTMVRLIQAMFIDEMTTIPLFQSHYGSINTLRYVYNRDGLSLFQSHYGSINTTDS